MLLLVFSIGSEQYALDVREVKEVIPFVSLQPIEGEEASVSGFIDYRGSRVPVIDLCEKKLGKKCHRRYSSRIMIVDAPQKGKSEATLLGLLAEKITDTLSIAAKDDVPQNTSLVEVKDLVGKRDG